MYEVNETLLTEARARIARERQADVPLVIQAPPGVELAGARAVVTLTRHAFRFGCNGFLIRSLADPGLQRAYEERFAALLNYATLPFYWSHYEPEPGLTREAQVRAMAAWCHAQGIRTKGHPLAWHATYPDWAHTLSDAEAMTRLRQRVTELVARFQGDVDTWDVVNEATVSARFANAVGREVARRGASAVVAEMLRLAHAAAPGAELLYNDFNLLAPACEALMRDLLAQGAPLHKLGLQSHMHSRTWPLEATWALCEQYAGLGLPLHFTELTILSGRAKDPNDTDWERVRTDWRTTPEGEEAQARYGEALYTLLYSHPALEAITWWDLSDHGAWQGAPAGLVRQDMSPKPLYERLMGLIHGAWATHAQGVLDAQGAFTARCTPGEHRLRVALPSGAVLTGEFAVATPKSGPLTVAVQ